MQRNAKFGYPLKFSIAWPVAVPSGCFQPAVRHSNTRTLTVGGPFLCVPYLYYRRLFRVFYPPVYVTNSLRGKSGPLKPSVLPTYLSGCVCMGVGACKRGFCNVWVFWKYVYLYLLCFCIVSFMYEYIYSYLLLVQGVLPPSENSVAVNNNNNNNNSVVGIATRYGLDGSEIEFRWGRNLPHPSRPVLGGLFPGVKRPRRAVNHPRPRLKKEWSYTTTPLWAFVACSKIIFAFFFN